MVTETTRWRSRTPAAMAVEATAFLAPIAASTLAVWLLARPLAGLAVVVRIVVLLVIAAAAAYVIERAARRLLPLSALLKLTMVFPDRAPSRFAVARQSGNPRVLLDRLRSPDTDEATVARNILALVGALSAHDRRTRGHSERVRAYTDLLSKELGLPEPDRDRLRWAALLHDIGKLRVAGAILNKAGKPNSREWQELHEHPRFGAELARPLLPWLGDWGRGIIEHHERYDGEGYPLGLRGEEISLGARVITVVDSFETMTAARSYKKAMSHRAAREELTRCSGTQFDPVIVRAFLAMSLPRVLWAMGPLSAAMQLPWINALQFAGARALAATGTAATAMSGPAIAAGLATAVAAPAATAHVPLHPHAVIGHGHPAANETADGRQTSAAHTGAPRQVSASRRTHQSGTATPTQHRRRRAGGAHPTTAPSGKPSSHATHRAQPSHTHPAKTPKPANGQPSDKPAKSKPSQAPKPSKPTRPSVVPVPPGQPSLPPLPSKAPRQGDNGGSDGSDSSA